MWVSITDCTLHTDSVPIVIVSAVALAPNREPWMWMSLVSLMLDGDSCGFFGAAEFTGMLCKNVRYKSLLLTVHVQGQLFVSPNFKLE